MILRKCKGCGALLQDEKPEEMGFIPTLTSVFAELGGELPMITQVLINVSDWFGKYWMLLLGIIFLLYIIYKVYVSNEDNKIRVAEKSLNIPIIIVPLLLLI